MTDEELKRLKELARSGKTTVTSVLPMPPGCVLVDEAVYRGLVEATVAVDEAWQSAGQGGIEFGDLVGGGISEKLDALSAALRKVPMELRGASKGKAES
jgi:hypothetical protein